MDDLPRLIAAAEGTAFAGLMLATNLMACLHDRGALTTQEARQVIDFALVDLERYRQPAAPLTKVLIDQARTHLEALLVQYRSPDSA
jgi:hypothetical protein